jgi:RNA polymerase sigma factor (sigma-70 family)
MDKMDKMKKPINDNTYDATARLVAKAKAGDKTAMKTLILAFKPLIYKTAGPFPDFEDAVSDFNLDLIKAVKAFEPEKGVYFPVYLKGVMMKQAKKRWRCRGPEAEYFDTAEEIHPGTANIEEDVTFRRDLREAHDAIEKLPFRQKCVIRAYYLYGIPIKTIAKRHGCSEHAVKDARYYGVENLKKALKLK